MPRKNRIFSKKTATTFQLVSKSQVDPSFTNTQTQGTLALRAVRGIPVPHDDNFDWNILGTKKQYDMHVVDDTMSDGGADAFFEDAEFEDFDQDFIHEMMQKPDDEATTVVSMANFPTHDPAKATSDEDKRYNFQMKRYEETEDLNMNDQRAQGPCQLEDYVGTLKHYELQMKRVSFMHNWKGPDVAVGELPKGKKVTFMPQTADSVFHSDEKGVYLTTVPSRKDLNPMVEYLSQKKDAARLTKQILQSEVSASLTEELPEVTVEEIDEVIDQLCPPKSTEQWDCKTIVSTYSNLENHPEVIAELPDPKRKIRLSRKSGLPKRSVQIAEGEEATSSPSNPNVEAENNDDEKDDGENQEDVDGDGDEMDEDRERDERIERLSVITSTMSSIGRPKDETPEERRERKKICHELRRLTRERKKQLKQAFRCETIVSRVDVQTAEVQRRTLPFGAPSALL